jgi:hypothetical protein
MRRLYEIVAWTFLSLLIAWPPIHIALARRYHFSTWRYGGLGMYAAPDGSDRDVYVFIRSCSGAVPEFPRSSEPSGSRLGFYYAVQGRRMDLLGSPSVNEAEERDLARIIKDIRSLSRPSDFERLSYWIDARLPQAGEGSSIAIVVTEPRLDGSAGRADANAFGFVRERRIWSPLPAMSGSAALSVIAQRLGSCP